MQHQSEKRKRKGILVSNIKQQYTLTFFRKCGYNYLQSNTKYLDNSMTLINKEMCIKCTGFR